MSDCSKDDRIWTNLIITIWHPIGGKTFKLNLSTKHSSWFFAVHLLPYGTVYSSWEHYRKILSDDSHHCMNVQNCLYRLPSWSYSQWWRQKNWFAYCKHYRLKANPEQIIQLECFVSDQHACCNAYSGSRHSLRMLCRYSHDCDGVEQGWIRLNVCLYSGKLTDEELTFSL